MRTTSNETLAYLAIVVVEKSDETDKQNKAGLESFQLQASVNQMR